MIRSTPLTLPWQERVVLDNGRELLVRPIHPKDAEPIRAGFHLLSEEEIRRRFLYVLKEISVEHAHRLTHPEPGRDFVLVAAEPEPPGEALVGAVARLAIDADGRAAEFAILVSRFIAGYGLGRLLLERMIEWARRRHVRELYGDVLEDNAAMLDLLRRLGFHRDPAPESPGVARVRLDLSKHRPRRRPL